MNKIPTLYVRDWNGDRSRVLPTLNVVLPEGAVATVKWDGTSVLIEGDTAWKRYELKPGKPAPSDFRPATPEPDPETGKQPGWLPIMEFDPADKWHREALDTAEWFNPDESRCLISDGTYELIGPKVQGNPYGRMEHWLVPHGCDKIHACPTDYAGLLDFFQSERGSGMEGIVWWANGKPVAKIKRRDFGLPWPIKDEA